jgi:hypothetical protein
MDGKRDNGWKPNGSKPDKPMYVLSIGESKYECKDMDEVRKIYHHKGDSVKGYVYILSTTIEHKIVTEPVILTRGS